MSNSPYAVSSVDTALRIALLLQAEGPLRSSVIADRLEIARSTAHRLLSMLAHRGFAEQREDKRYVVGPVLRSLSVPSSRTARLKAVAVPHLIELRDLTRETVNLEMLSGAQIKYLETFESPELLRVGNRDGWLSPAWRVSGGRALLAQFPDREVLRILADEEIASDELERLLKGLVLVRKRGFALNDFEPEVSAIAQPVKDEDGTAVAAVAVAMPSSRFSRERLPELTKVLARTVGRIERALAEDID